MRERHDSTPAFEGERPPFEPGNDLAKTQGAMAEVAAHAWLAEQPFGICS